MGGRAGKDKEKDGGVGLLRERGKGKHLSVTVIPWNVDIFFSNVDIL